MRRPIALLAAALVCCGLAGAPSLLAAAPPLEKLPPPTAYRRVTPRVPAPGADNADVDGVLVRLAHRIDTVDRRIEAVDAALANGQAIAKMKRGLAMVGDELGSLVPEVDRLRTAVEASARPLASLGPLAKDADALAAEASPVRTASNVAELRARLKTTRATLERMRAALSNPEPKLEPKLEPKTAPSPP